MKKEDPEVTSLLGELEAIVDRFAGPGIALQEIRRDVGMTNSATGIRRRLRDIHRLTDGEIDLRVFGPGAWRL